VLSDALSHPWIVPSHLTKHGVFESIGYLASTAKTEEFGQHAESVKGTQLGANLEVSVCDAPVARPLAPPPLQRFELLQQWEGTVLSDAGEEFIAELRDLTDPSRPREEVRLPLAEIADDDLASIEPGCVFYWSIGYKVSTSGRKERVSLIRVRRLPAWTRREVEAVEVEAEELGRRFGGGAYADKASG